MPTYNFRNLRSGLRPEAALIALRGNSIEGSVERLQRERDEKFAASMAKMERDHSAYQRHWDRLNADVGAAEAAGKSAEQIEAIRDEYKELWRRRSCDC